MKCFILRVDFDGAEDGARWMVVSANKVEDYKKAFEIINTHTESLDIDKVVTSHRDTFVVLRRLPDSLTDEDRNNILEAGWIIREIDVDNLTDDVMIEWKKANIDKYGEVCFTCDYKHTDYGIRSAYVSLALI